MEFGFQNPLRSRTVIFCAHCLIQRRSFMTIHVNQRFGHYSTVFEEINHNLMLETLQNKNNKDIQIVVDFHFGQGENRQLVY